MKTNNRGFTLIELMLVVGIIGVLASIAVPQLQKAALRAKQTERVIMTDAIKLQLVTYVSGNSRWPGASNVGGYDFYSNLNPPIPNWYYDIPAGKRRWNERDATWSWFTGVPTGALYHTYRAVGVGVPGRGPITMQILAAGDLDNDGRPSFFNRVVMMPNLGTVEEPETGFVTRETIGYY